MPATGTRAQTERRVRFPVHANGTILRHVAAAKEEPRVGENGGEMLHVQISHDMFTQIVGMHDIFRTAGSMRKGTETRAEERGEPVSYLRVESR